MLAPPLTQIRIEQEAALKELVSYAGSNVHLARMLQVPVSTVNSWVSRGRISKDGAERVQLNNYFKGKFPVSKLRPETNY